MFRIAQRSHIASEKQVFACNRIWLSWIACMVTAVSSACCVPEIAAGDWPQVLGPHRDGIALGEKLLPAWPVTGPKLIWQQPVGEGYAGVAVSGDTLIVFSRTGNQEIVEARSAATGKSLWRSASPCAYRGGISADNGPRCVPLIHDNVVYVFGVEGRLQALNLADGKVVWSRDTQADFAPPEGYFGVGSTPVIHGKYLIANIGNRDDAAVVAFDLKNGETAWSAYQDTASYSSPVVRTIDGIDHALIVTRLNLISLDPENGALRFEFPFGQRGPTVNGASPVLIGNQVFVSSSYNIGSLLVDASVPNGQEVWRDNASLLATQYATPILHNGMLYAVDGRQDAGPGSATIKCIDTKTRKVLWKKSGFDYGTMVLVNDELLMLTYTGELIRLQASPTAYTQTARLTVLTGNSDGYHLPAISNGRLFIRDDKTLKALQVGTTAP